jgi:hypothetical protein
MGKNGESMCFPMAWMLITEQGTLLSDFTIHMKNSLILSAKRLLPVIPLCFLYYVCLRSCMPVAAASFTIPSFLEICRENN